MNRIGIDLGGTKIEGIVLDPEGKELCRRRLATEQHDGGYEGILNRIRHLYDMLADRAGAPNTFGIGTPGAISHKIREGSSENSRVASDLLVDMVERGIRADRHSESYCL